jgi:FlaA1/EpsC-like NDP-sugar epimerase
MRKVLICGGGEAGIMVKEEILRHPEEHIEVVGFIDDDITKIGTTIHGKPVFGGRKDLKEQIRTLGITEVIIAMPSISKKVIKDIVKICQSEKVKLLIVPSTMEIIEGVVRFDQIKRLDLADLLERDEVNVDTEEIQEYIQGRRIFVTGAAGSIGSELIRELLNYDPHILIGLDINENGLFYLTHDIRKSLKNGTRFIPSVADIKDRRIINELFEGYNPEIVFHAAAYKHVPLMENHKRMIFLNNVIGTHNMLDTALEHGVDKFICISTDKAVYPVSIMGKTKRICELLTGAYNSRGLESCSVRFGNVLGSNGSVITIFHEQIRRGGPITITSPCMERYFMTVQEAARLVMQAASCGGNGNVYVLDMGEPIKIKDLAENLVILSGLTPGIDIKIHYTGVRAGEKLSEELFYRESEVTESCYRGIFIERCRASGKELLDLIMDTEREIYHLSGRDINHAIDRVLQKSAGYSFKSELKV